VIFEDFSKGRYAVATTLSTLLFLVMVGLGYLMIRVLRRDELS
jgi:ABC-type sugar transport system permease subunit